MKILIGDEVRILTGCAHQKSQLKWFMSEGITCRVNAKGQVYTTDDWMNGKDKYQAQNDDGFNLGALDYCRPNEWFEANCSRLPLTEADIFANTASSSIVGNFPAVYFLTLDGVIVYVGKAKNMRKRINNHNYYAKVDFNDARLLIHESIPDLHYSDFEHVESFYINLLKPRFNEQIPMICKTGSELIKGAA